MSKPLVISGKRKDGRRPHEYTAPNCTVGSMKNAQGSSYVETRGTKVLCSVYGPKQTADDPTETCDIKVNFSVAAFAEEAHRTHRGPPSSEDRHKAVSLQEAFEYAVLCENYPKARIELDFLVLERGADDYTAAVLAGSLALMDAGIDMHDIVTASTASFTQAGELLLDPTARECRRAVATVTTTCLAKLGNILSVNMTGASAPDATDEAVKLCCKACAAMREVAVATMRDAENKNA